MVSCIDRNVALDGTNRASHEALFPKRCGSDDLDGVGQRLGQCRILPISSVAVLESWFLRGDDAYPGSGPQVPFLTAAFPSMDSRDNVNGLDCGLGDPGGGEPPGEPRP